MRMIARLAALAAGMFIATSAAQAVSVRVDLSSQRMHVTTKSGQTYNWAISSGRGVHATPRGSYRPYSLQRMHYSRKYNNAPMPYSIFFRGGYAIHGTGAVSMLGRPASHGCIRLATGNAAALFALVKKEGASISIAGSTPGRTMIAKGKGGKTKIAKARKKGSTALAYAPVRKKTAPSVRAWQANPARSTSGGLY